MSEASTDPLELPQFLRRTGTMRIQRAPRKKKLRAQRPDGERWLVAERWEVFVDQHVPKLAVGRRIVWAVEGRKWARLHDGHAQTKIPMRDWLRLKADGRQVR